MASVAELAPSSAPIANLHWQPFAWQRAIRASDLSSTAKLVAYTMATYADRDGRCFPLIATLSEDCGKGPRVIKRALSDLRHSGFLTADTRGRGRSNLYVLLLPPPGGTGVVHDPSEAQRGVAHDPQNNSTDLTTQDLPNSLRSFGAATPQEAAMPQDTLGGMPEPQKREPAGAGALIAEWLKHCKKRPPERVIGHVAREIRKLLAEGIAYDDLRRGLAQWHKRGLHPSALASCVHEVMNLLPDSSPLHEANRQLRSVDGSLERVSPFERINEEPVQRPGFVHGVDDVIWLNPMDIPEVGCEETEWIIPEF